jgi:alcohol dehydrogenase YqhD (iron-dependent ADH family)
VRPEYVLSLGERPELDVLLALAGAAVLDRTDPAEEVAEQGVLATGKSWDIIIGLRRLKTCLTLCMILPGC